jgi:hypothetical protein
MNGVVISWIHGILLGLSTAPRLAIAVNNSVITSCGGGKFLLKEDNFVKLINPFRVILMATILIVVSMTSPTIARDEGMYPADPSFLKVEGYPQVLVCPSLQFVNEAPQAYYKVFGQWPQTFAEIEEAGLIRSNLTIEGSYVITPDDGKFDDPADILYIFRGPQTPPQIATLGQVALSGTAQANPEAASTVSSLPNGATATSLPALKNLHVYAEQSRRKLESDNKPEANQGALRYGGNLAAHKLLAIAYMCMLGAADYRSVYGTFPDKWDNFVDTGFCPVTSDMVNPATGQPFSTDGSPYSFAFIKRSNGGFSVGVHGDNDDYIKAW